MVFASCSNAFEESKKLLKDYESALDKATTCEDLEKATADFEAAGQKFDEKYKNDSTAISKEQQEELGKLNKQVKQKASSKSKELCE